MGTLGCETPLSLLRLPLFPVVQDTLDADAFLMIDEDYSIPFVLDRF